MSELNNREHEQDKHAPETGRDPGDSPARGFLSSFKDFRVRRRLAARVLAIPEGDWEALRKLAQEEGWTCTAEELKAAMPSAFFRVQGKHPNKFWSKPSGA